MIELFQRRFSALPRVVLILAVLAAPGAQAAVAQDRDDRKHAEEMAREGMERIMRALELFMDSIPQYEMPEVNEHGDIIIRRKRGHEDRAPKADKEEPGTEDT